MSAFPPSGDVRIGAEVEWLVFDRSDPSRDVAASMTAAIAAGSLPAGGTITVEPGGQVELVTVPHVDPRRLVDAIEVDTVALSARFDEHDLVLVPLGLDPIRAPRRSLDLPRYVGMERYFEKVSPAGIEMMCLTASLQLNIDFGSDPATTWRHADSLAPLLSAAFANSPTLDGTNPRPVSQRQRIWAATDTTRTRPVGSMLVDWPAYVLDSRVMLRDGPDGLEPILDRLVFRDWLDHHEPPTTDDLALHLTTLFPPLRPRGYLELRMIDALPSEGRAAAIATVWSLLTDADIGERAVEVCRTIADPWHVARDTGLADPELRAVTTAVLEAATDSVRRFDRGLGRMCDAWLERVRAADTGNYFDHRNVVAQAEGY